MKTQATILAILGSLCWAAKGQGNFIYDQQSSVEGVWGEGGGYIEPNQPMGQSFIPELDSVGFIRLDVFTHGSAGSVYVNLLADSITGPLLGRSESAAVSSDGPVNLVFVTPVSVTPGVTYYFQPVASNDRLAVAGDAGGFYYSYPAGAAFFKGVAGDQDLWFREGLYVVPEPSPVWLLLVGSMVFGFLAHCRRARTVSGR